MTSLTSHRYARGCTKADVETEGASNHVGQRFPESRWGTTDLAKGEHLDADVVWVVGTDAETRRRSGG